MCEFEARLWVTVLAVCLQGGSSIYPWKGMNIEQYTVLVSDYQELQHERDTIKKELAAG